jgi:antitoxin CptB
MDPDLGKLRWRCRRGMKELDLLLTRYVDEHYRDAAPVQQDAFRRLLACPDPLIHDYLLGRLPAPDPALAALIERMTDPPSSAAG